MTGVQPFLRAARADDAPFLADMLVEASEWAGPRSRSRVDVLAEDATRRYVSGWPRSGDVGTVAELPEGERIGACWFRILPASLPGRGFVASGVPELILGVKPVWRAQGVGRALLRAVLDQARAAGHARISLSVGEGNVAHRLYRSEGFIEVGGTGTAERGAARVMVLTLR